MSQPITVDGMKARLAEVWGDDVELRVVEDTAGRVIVEAWAMLALDGRWKPQARKVDARIVRMDDE